MRFSRFKILLLLLFLTGSCVSKFIPEVREAGELLVVEGLITDQPGINTVKLSKSVPLDKKSAKRPLKGCTVTISDDAGNIYNLKETSNGTYITDSSEFRGVVGRKYQLRVKVNDASLSNDTYESEPMEMKPVPSIDSLYYEKLTLKMDKDTIPSVEGCQIYIDTHDPEGKCRFYRWTFTETWQIVLPWPTEKSVCWESENSKTINIKTTSSLSEDRINGFPLQFISNNQSDRLGIKYSLLARQLSISEDEFDYWSRLKSISEETGSLYDITPATVTGNVYNINDPYEQVLGYFSVSAVASRRIFIKDSFAGLINLYRYCVTDTIYTDHIPGLNQTIWILINYDYEFPPYKLATRFRDCADCTTRGTTVEPSFWRDDEK